MGSSSSSTRAVRRFDFPRGSHARKVWPRLRSELDRRFGASPRPAPDTDPAGYAEELLRQAAGPPPAKRVLSWGTPRYVRHRSHLVGRMIDARPFAASPWADSEGVREELLRAGERAWQLFGGRGNVHHVEGTREDVRRLRRRVDVMAVVAFADFRDPGKRHIFVRGGGRGMTPDVLQDRLLAALLHLPAKWPWEPDPDPDWQPDEDRVSIPMDVGKVAAAKAHMIRRRHRVVAESPTRFRIEARPTATNEDWAADWEAYKRILLSRDEPASVDRAPPAFAAA